MLSPYLAQVPQTGQTAIYATGDDGDLRAGVPSPEPRFTDNGDGTITDNLSGLIWLKNANCFGTKAWSIAITDASTLNDGECGLSDGSMEGVWRLPNVKELQSLISIQYSLPALSDTEGTRKWVEGDPFSDVQSGYNYWSSNTNVNNASIAWVVYLGLDYVYDDSKASIGHVWPVRGGQIE